ncbi:MAG: hypothetical protein AAFX87_16190 [Bacteroidota bacterium]
MASAGAEERAYLSHLEKSLDPQVAGLQSFTAPLTETFKIGVGRGFSAARFPAHIPTGQAGQRLRINRSRVRLAKPSPRVGYPIQLPAIE